MVHLEFNYESGINPKTKKTEMMRSKCKHCSVSYSGKNPTNLFFHLERKHKSIYKSVREKDDRVHAQKIGESAMSTSKASTYLETRESSLLGKWVNASPRIAKLPPRTNKEEEDSLRSLSLWIGASFTPLSAVEDPGFETILKSFNIRASS